MMHIAVAEGASSFVTFEKKLKRLAGADAPVPVEVAVLMAKLYFYYASMNAGKSTVLLQTAFNYRERGMEPML